MDDPKIKVEVSKPTLTEIIKPTLEENKPTNQQENN